MSEWHNGRRQYGPHCNGIVGGWQWWAIYEEWVDGIGQFRIEMYGPVRPLGNDAVGEVACDAQVAAWQERFPALEIVADEPQKGGE